MNNINCAGTALNLKTFSDAKVHIFTNNRVSQSNMHLQKVLGAHAEVLCDDRGVKSFGVVEKPALVAQRVTVQLLKVGPPRALMKGHKKAH